LCGDAPLIEGRTLAELIRVHRRSGNAATVLTAVLETPRGYGRIVRGPDGAVERIVEERDATDAEKKIGEINSGMYCFAAKAVAAALPRIGTKNGSGEYYLTDALEIIRRAGGRIGAVAAPAAQEALGINTRAELAEAGACARMRTAKRLMAAGVTIIDPAGSCISPEVRIGTDAVIMPGCIIEGATVIGEGARIGPFAVIKDARIGKDAEVRASFLLGARVGDGAKVGPYAHLRPGTVLERGARVGNFSETKNARVGRGSKINHLSYIGDAVLGAGVNVGAGTITCNYDGTHKHRTVIGDGAFIGSNTNLVAPVRVGPRALIGAGSTITESVPADALAIARTRQVNKRRARAQSSRK
jgi:bifunctional UDP-N-acetylglucosamine pyrophosphorylase/glucosamine-1-phosphate N-acetyltransferase